MATKKYLSLDRLTEYDALIKAKIDEGDASTLSLSKEYTDEKIAAIPEVDAYTKSEMDAALLDKADKYHNHDDVYYTETEVDALLANKANTTHAHEDLYYTKEQIDAFELITIADIDSICGTTIQIASEVMF